MNAEQKTMLFPFRPLDYTAAETWLNEQAQAGWALAALGAWQTARFRRAAQPRQYAVVLRHVPSAAGARREAFDAYKAFLESCGWTYIASQTYLHVFATRPGETLPPLDTDPATEATQIRKQYVRRVLLGWLLLALYALLLFLMLRGTEPTWVLALSNNMAVAAIPLLAVLLGATLVQGMELLRWEPRLRAAQKEGTPLPRRPVARAWRQGVLEMGCTIAALLLAAAALIADTAQDVSNIRFLLQAIFTVFLVLCMRPEYKDTPKRMIAGALAGISLIGWLASMNMPKPAITEARLENLPAVTGLVGEVHYRMLESSRSLLLSRVEYAESGEGSTTSYCVDAATDALADAAFNDLVYKFRSNAYSGQEPGLQPAAVAGMEQALFYEGGYFQMLALRRGRRIVRVEAFSDTQPWDAQPQQEPHSLRNPAVLAQVLEVFFAEGKGN